MFQIQYKQEEVRTEEAKIFYFCDGEKMKSSMQQRIQ